MIILLLLVILNEIVALIGCNSNYENENILLVTFYPMTELLEVQNKEKKINKDQIESVKKFEYKKIGFVVNGHNSEEISSISSKFKHIIIPLILKNDILKEKTINIIYTKILGDGERVAAKLFSLGCEIIVSVGGDRLHFEVLNGIMRFGEKKQRKQNVAIAFINLGTKNDIEKGFGLNIYHEKYEEQVNYIAKGFTTRIDVGKVTYTSFSEKNIKLQSYFFNSSSYGDSPSMKKAIEKSRKENRFPKDLILTKEIKVKYSLNEQPQIQLNSNWGSVTNGKYFSGGLLVSPRAEIFDGKLDVCLISEIGKWEKSSFEKKVKKGNHLTNDLVTFDQPTVVSITPQLDTNVLIECDGLLVGRLPARWVILSKEIDIIVPETWEVLIN